MCVYAVGLKAKAKAKSDTKDSITKLWDSGENSILFSPNIRNQCTNHYYNMR